jgi:uncharacterized membrane protein
MGVFLGKISSKQRFSNKKINHMDRNMGSTDRIIRLVVAAVFTILYATGVVSGTLGIVLVVIAVIFALTSFVSFCPLYKLIGVSTNKGEKQ